MILFVNSKMRFSNGSITAAILAATAATLTSTTEAATTPSPRRGLKHDKGSKHDGKKIKVLAVQKGQGCYLAELGLGVYTLFITEMNPETILFQERPGRQAFTIPTSAFTQDFSKNFPLDDLPNAAISFVESDGQGNTLIVQLSNPTSTFNDGMGMQYTVKQSPSQSDVVPLEGFVNNDDDSYVDNSCSLFIDGINRYMNLNVYD